MVRKDYVQLALSVSSLILLGYACKQLKDVFFPFNTRSKSDIKALLRKLGRTKCDADSITYYEQIVAMQLVDPENVEIGFNNIGGQAPLIKELRNIVLRPVQNQELAAQSSLIQPTKGVLLYGPPGTGKTMLARAVAKESGFVFINLDFSQVLSKYVGESEKLITAVFNLASKLTPAIIFIDEIDCYFRRRAESDQEFSSQMKAAFMSCWDGFEKKDQVIVMAATNRPDVIDPAILRRLASKFEVPLPNKSQREEILKIILENEKTGPDINLARLAAETEGFSGDDLRELCKGAVMRALGDSEDGELRAVTMGDLKAARKRILPTSATIGGH
eukprot:c16769_g1_i3.p1 GENE.c16769_g1_i3~~c16769_g1_i3.p1  ORF type:complete len:341 (+),score=89.61 c16769_g1_i3:28-1023(+)